MPDYALPHDGTLSMASNLNKAGEVQFGCGQDRTKGAVFKCGHPRSPENVKLFGGVQSGCRCCHDERQAQRRIAAEEQRERLGDLMMQARREGKSTKEIAEMFGVSEPTVSRYAPVSRAATRDPLFHERAIKRAAEIVGSRPIELTSPIRFPRLVRARWAVMMAMHRRGVSLCRIGKRFGRDHSTVIYGIRQGERELQRSDAFRAMFEQVDAA